jgi:hypothetical protein
MLQAVAAVSRLNSSAPSSAVQPNVTAALNTLVARVAAILAAEGPRDIVLSNYRAALNLPDLQPPPPPANQPAVVPEPSSLRAPSPGAKAGIAVGSFVAALLLVLAFMGVALRDSFKMARKLRWANTPPGAGEVAVIAGKSGIANCNSCRSLRTPAAAGRLVCDMHCITQICLLWTSSSASSSLSD